LAVLVIAVGVALVGMSQMSSKADVVGSDDVPSVMLISKIQKSVEYSRAYQNRSGGVLVQKIRLSAVSVLEG
jgi:hypothetical protein